MYFVVSLVRTDGSEIKEQYVMWETVARVVEALGSSLPTIERIVISIKPGPAPG